MGRYLPQEADEIGPFITLMKAAGVRRYLEIGLRFGSTFHMVGSNLPMESSLLGIDVGKRSDLKSSIHVVMDDLSRRYDHHVQVIWGDSTDIDTVRLAHLAGPFDAVFIDGGHDFDTVLADWRNYSALAPMIAFHDIVASNLGVKQHWDRIKSRYDHVEFVADNNEMGIGVLWQKDGFQREITPESL